MKKSVLTMSAAATLAFGVACAHAAAPESGGQDCASLGEVALLARALAEEKVDKPRAHSILRRMYEIPDAEARQLARLVVESAYRDSSPAGEFALKFEAVCTVNGGDITSLLNRGGSKAAARAKVM
jgi:hypothetical protein